MQGNLFTKKKELSVQERVESCTARNRSLHASQRCISALLRSESGCDQVSCEYVYWRRRYINKDFRPGVTAWLPVGVCSARNWDPIVPMIANIL